MNVATTVKWLPVVLWNVLQTQQKILQWTKKKKIIIKNKAKGMTNTTTSRTNKWELKPIERTVCQSNSEVQRFGVATPAGPTLEPLRIVSCPSQLANALIYAAGGGGAGESKKGEPNASRHSKWDKAAARAWLIQSEAAGVALQPAVLRGWMGGGNAARGLRYLVFFPFIFFFFLTTSMPAELAFGLGKFCNYSNYNYRTQRTRPR